MLFSLWKSRQNFCSGSHVNQAENLQSLPLTMGFLRLWSELMAERPGRGCSVPAATLLRIRALRGVCFLSGLQLCCSHLSQGEQRLLRQRQALGSELVVQNGVGQRGVCCGCVVQPELRPRFRVRATPRGARSLSLSSLTCQGKKRYKSKLTHRTSALRAPGTSVLKPGCTLESCWASELQTEAALGLLPPVCGLVCAPATRGTPGLQPQNPHQHSAGGPVPQASLHLLSNVTVPGRYKPTGLQHLVLNGS